MSNGSRKIRSVAILGGGPVAAVLAHCLKKSGIDVAIIYRPKHTPLVVGESLVPAVIPLLRMMGVEDEVKSFSLYKPGATVNLSDTLNLSFPFAGIPGAKVKYAYNVPRDKFDQALLGAARKAGVHIIEGMAGLERVPGTDRVQFNAESLALLKDVFPRGPDYIVDATGRIRLVPNLLGLPSRKGSRTDTALFAHVDTAKLDQEGHVHSTRLEHGWSWRIPLPDRVSVGVVIGTQHLPRFGCTKEEQFDNLLKQDAVLSKVASHSKRLTPVVEHTNYQLVSERMSGDGWALVGDTAGFIDPVFSSGLLIGMQGAVELADAISKGTPAAMRHYEAEVTRHLEGWQDIVEAFYNGRLFTSFVSGQVMMKHWIFRQMFPHFQKHFGRIFTGVASNSHYSIGMLRWVVKYGLGEEDPKKLMIH